MKCLLLASLTAQASSPPEKKQTPGPERKPEKVFQASIFSGGIHLHFTTGGDVTSQLFFAEIYKQSTLKHHKNKWTIMIFSRPKGAKGDALKPKKRDMSDI